MFNSLKDLNPQLGILLLITLFTSCKEEKGIPFPENASGFKAPVTKAFTMPEAKPFVWQPIDPDSIPKAITLPLNFDKLPYKNFSINGFKPLKVPPSTQPLNWKNLEEIKINLDTIKGKPVVKKFKLLPEPTITKVIPPTKLENTTSGILQLSQKEGLPGHANYAIVTDNYGSIWIATEQGLAKYVGDEIRTYNFLEHATETITDLKIDQNGRLLITAFESGLYKLDIPTGIVEYFDIGSSFVRIKEDHQGVIWLGNLERGLYFFKPEQDSIYQLVVPSPGINNNLTLGCFEDSNNNLWFGFAGNVVIINPERTSLKLLADDQFNPSTPYDFTEDAKGAVWLSTKGNGVRSVSIAEDKIYILGKEQNFTGGAKGIIEDRLKRIWIMNDDTVTIYDPAKSRMKKIPTQTAYGAIGFPAFSMQDKNGVIWIGSQKKGVLLADALGPLAEHFDKSNGLADNDVWGVAEDEKERIWIATYGGINVYDPEKERLYYLKNLEQYKPNNYRAMTLLADGRIVAGSIGSFSIIDLSKNTVTVYPSPKIADYFRDAELDRESNIWLATSNGIIRFNPEKNTWNLLDKNDGRPSGAFWSVFSDSEGNFRFISEGGVDIIDPKAETSAFINKNNGLNSDEVFAGFQSSRDEIIIGGNKGLTIINKGKTQITNITSADGLIPQTIFDLVEYNGKIRIGSQNGLIIAQRPDANDSIWRFTNYGKSEGFPFNDYNQTASIYTKSGTGWHGATPVLSIIHQEPLINDSSPAVQITGINIMDQHPSFQDADYLSAFIQQGDTLWNSMGTKFLTKDAQHEDTTYLAINKIKWDSLQASTQMPVGLELPHTQNSVSFTFANLDMRGRDKIVYRYVLEGTDKRWSEIDPKPGSKNYYNLLSGDYVFKVATRGFNGVWSEPAEFAFTILPPWWETWWFRILSVIALIIVVYAIVQERSRNLKKQNVQLEEKVLVRTKELKLSLEELRAAQAQLIQSEKMASLGELTAGIAHEIQNPLNFVNNFSEVNKELLSEMKNELDRQNYEEAKNLANDVISNQEKINHHGKRAAGIVKGMLQHSRSSSGVKEPTDVNALADEYLRLAYHGLRAKDKTFNAVMKTDFDESIGSINVVPQDMGRVILNLITNAFYAVTEKKKQDGYEPTVTVSTKKGNGNVAIHVKDNGNGIPQEVVDKIFQPFFTTKPTGQGTGLGLSMSYDIVKAHGGDIIVETKTGEGSEFCIEIPDNRYRR